MEEYYVLLASLIFIEPRVYSRAAPLRRKARSRARGVNRRRRRRCRPTPQGPRGHFRDLCSHEGAHAEEAGVNVLGCPSGSHQNPRRGGGQ